MAIEHPASLDHRAKVYSALGEPVRLALVDRLALGDASPGELGSYVHIGTNLLAHHLKVLEGAAVISRLRSEGDKRRSYVQLRLDDPVVRAAVAIQDLGTVPRVLFVCTQNSARSQLALAYWRQVSPVPAASAGTHPAPRVNPKAVVAGRRYGLHLADARTAELDEVQRRSDLVVAVCDNAHEELDPAIRRLHWAIPDPVRVNTDSAFDAAFGQISRRVDALAAAVAPPSGADTQAELT